MEQKEAIPTLILGKDLPAVLPTGFEKSPIFQVLVYMKEIMMGKPSSVVVICQLQSIVYDQMEKVSSKNHQIDNDSYTQGLLFRKYRAQQIYQLIFMTAEEVLSKPFLFWLKQLPHHFTNWLFLCFFFLVGRQCLQFFYLTHFDWLRANFWNTVAHN